MIIIERRGNKRIGYLYLAFLSMKRYRPHYIRRKKELIMTAETEGLMDDRVFEYRLKHHLPDKITRKY